MSGNHLPCAEQCVGSLEVNLDGAGISDCGTMASCNWGACLADPEACEQSCLNKPSGIYD